MALCSECLTQRVDRGRHVYEALESAKNYIEKGDYYNAKQDYNFIYHLLVGRNRCKSCIEEIKSKIDAL